MPRGADRLSLLGRVTALLRARSIPFAVIGAAAMAVHGVSRATRDVDLFTVNPATLEAATWASLAGDAPRIRVGGSDDPLAGVARFLAAGEPPLDLVVGKTAWQAEIPGRARPSVIEGVEAPVAGAADLVLLKLYAGGPQDAWDIEQLLAGPDRAALVAEVQGRLAALPAHSQDLWNRIVGHRG